jgi:hypothetical protein
MKLLKGGNRPFRGCSARTGDLFYWPSGHSVRAEEDTDIVMFSPQNEHGLVIDHVLHKVGD